MTFNHDEKTFRIENEDQGYGLHIGGYSGTAGDSLTPIGKTNLNGMKFSTNDRDNDNSNSTHCSRRWKGGWWFNA